MMKKVDPDLDDFDEFAAVHHSMEHWVPGGQTFKGHPVSVDVTAGRNFHEEHVAVVQVRGPRGETFVAVQQVSDEAELAAVWTKAVRNVLGWDAVEFHTLLDQGFRRRGYAWLCDGCGASSGYFGYMVQDSLWKEYVGPPDAGHLCVSCLERRVGRPLVLSDFAVDMPINDPIRYGFELARREADRTAI